MGTAVLMALPGWAQQPAERHDDHEHTPHDVLEVLHDMGLCAGFVSALVATGAGKALQAMKDVTVFAPVDAAWAGAPALQAERLRMVRQHIFNARWAGSGGDPQRLTNLNQHTMDADIDSIGGVGFVMQGIPVHNGWVHVVKRLLA
ncbi:MAG: hypothetical protein EON92_02125 [Burkholderiales bacterium]|nr:MAG: hypothetical protein EON92_02125 [Burkholderiales bacterium]